MGMAPSPMGPMGSYPESLHARSHMFHITAGRQLNNRSGCDRYRLGANPLKSTELRRTFVKLQRPHLVQWPRLLFTT